VTSLEKFAVAEACNRFLDLNVFHLVRGRYVCNEEERFPFNLIGLDLSDSEESFVENMETGQTVSHKKGRFILIPSYTRVYYRNRGDYDFIAIHFNLTFCYGIDLFRNCDRFFVWEDPHLAELLQTLTSPGGDDFRKICMLKTVIWDICMRFPPAFDRDLLIAGNRYIEVIEYIETHLDATLSISDLAGHFGERREVFSRNFRKNLQISPKAFLENALVKKIMSKLLTPGARIKEVAEKLNFRSEFYMSFFFKKHTGMSPREYQQKFRM